MQYRSFAQLLRNLDRPARRGPLAMVLVQDEFALTETLAHLAKLGFARLVVLGERPRGKTNLPILTAPYDTHKPGAFALAYSALADRVAGAWLFGCWNGEFLYFPYCDSRTIGDLTSFAADERRRAIGGVVVDVFPQNLAQLSGGTQNTVWVDHLGYSFADPSPATSATPTPLFGGLRERLSTGRAAADRIDRSLIIRATSGAELGPDGIWSDPDLNSRHCRWHHSPTAVLASYRMALWHAARSDRAFQDLVWPGATQLTWSAKQFSELGMMEPGQWV